MTEVNLAQWKKCEPEESPKHCANVGYVGGSSGAGAVSIPYKGPTHNCLL